MYYTTSNHSRPYHALARPPLCRRDSKAKANSILKQEGEFNSRHYSLSVLSTEPNKPSSSSPAPSQLFPVDLSELQAVNSMWAKQGRSQRGLELISGDLIGLKKTQACASSDMMITFHPTESTSFAVSATTAFVSMSPSTSTTSTSCSSLPSALFSSLGTSSSASSSSTVTVVCQVTPCTGEGGPKCLVDGCCASVGDAIQHRHPRLERNVRTVPRHLKQRSSLVSPHKPLAVRTPVASSASPLHVLLDEAKRKDGICSAELAIQETLSAKTTMKNMHDIQGRSRSLSITVDGLERRPTPIPNRPSLGTTLIESFISFSNKLPSSSYSLSYDVYPNTDIHATSTDESIPLLPLHHRKIPYPSQDCARKFPPPLPRPHSPFRARSPPRHPTPRFRLIENKEYLRMKAVWNRLSCADSIAVDVFIDTVHDGEGDDDGTTTAFGIRLHELNCGCEDECDHEYEDGQGREKEEAGTSSSTGRRSSSSSRRILYPYPLPSPSLVDKQGNLHTGCELIVGVAIDGIKESSLGVGMRQRRERGSHCKLGTDTAKLDLLDGLSSLTNLVSSSSSSLSSLSSSVRRTLDSLSRALVEGHMRRSVGIDVSSASLSSPGAYHGLENHRPQAESNALPHVAATIRSRSHRSMSGPEGL